ncbi:MAG: prepilin-type cleavage/methylation domain-containing protein [Gammaproteobacteria bacterium]|nr:prepilin-type cleavage/methylation domain-containing protein [Gammaproteobacteria bacterium]MBU1970062.1 prepilin-type cleavage/methylation domain-containing protein [Gammaproteobacteria bacterium]
MQLQNGKSSQQGVVIIEAMIAILIFSIGVLGIVGMQASMVKNTSESKFRADASFIAQQQIGFLWTSPDSMPADGSSITSNISNVLPAGTLTISRSGVEYTVTVNWRQPGEEQHNFTALASINGV